MSKRNLCEGMDFLSRAKWVTIEPRDVLYFRDARPVAPGACEHGGSAGSGSNWPLPHVFYSAILSALYERFPNHQSWERKHQHRREKKDANYQISAMRFGWVRTIGFFPVLPDGTYLFPTPADLVPNLNENDSIDTKENRGKVEPINVEYMRPLKLKGDFFHNLPSPLRYLVANVTPPRKAKLGEWIDLENLIAYLNGNKKLCTVSRSTFADEESRPGLAINDETRTAEKGNFFQTNYLRLKDGVKLGGWVDTTPRMCKGTDREVPSVSDLIDQLIEKRSSYPVVLGGQRGVGWLRKGSPPDMTQLPIPSGTTKIKWVLLTPALFTEGWCPFWAKEGTFYLKENEGEMKLAFQDDQKDAYKINLVAARIPKSLWYSGWRLSKAEDGSSGGPKPTRMFVPAGSVFYFETENSEATAALVRAFHLRCRSDLLGEKGLGFGVCGTWDFFEFGSQSR